MTKQLRSFAVVTVIAACGVLGVHAASAKGGLVRNYPWPPPCAYAGYPDIHCPSFREALDSPQCRPILDKLGDVDPADWQSRRSLVDTAKRIGCVPRPEGSR